MCDYKWILKTHPASLWLINILIFNNLSLQTFSIKCLRVFVCNSRGTETINKKENILWKTHRRPLSIKVLI